MNRPSAISRRQWIGSGLATCGFLAASGLGLAQAADLPTLKGYTRPGPVTERGRAPGLQSRLISENSGGEKTYAVVFAKGDEVLSGLTEFAARENLTAGYFTAIGALQSARFGWFDRAHNAYRHIPIKEQVELISLIGNVALVNGAPQIHAHGAVGFCDGQMRGGHLLEAIAWPTLELFFTACPTTLIKEHDDETDLSLFDLKT
ncbi:MAG TPA: PPC domain-containing DNA-binding protein [Verrucomicrobiae bacterium]|nr:PPC domain-containing DNA-binding protein [Verrucomicrobiae bacterium]